VLVLSLLPIATFVSSFGISKQVILAQGRTALTATETESVYDRAGEVKTSTNKVIGVRSDGSTVRALTVSIPGDRGVAELRHILDLSKGEEIVVDGLTESVSTFPIPSRGVDLHKQMPRCTTEDPRTRGFLLGYDVVQVVYERARATRTFRQEQWLAPALNCLPLKQIFYIGSTAADMYAANVKEVTQITTTEPPPVLFEKPSGYAERSASQRRSEFSRRYPEVPIPEPLREADREDDRLYHLRQADRGN
jgi:hypothetical protein